MPAGMGRSAVTDTERKKRGDSVQKDLLYMDRLRDRGKKITGKILTVLEYLWVMAVILNGNTVFHANATANLYLLELAVGLTYAVLIANFLIYNVRPTRQNVLITLFILLYCSIYMSVMQTQMNAGVYIMLFVVGAPALYLLFSELIRLGRLLQLLRRFVNVLCVLAVVSLFFWIFGVVLKLIPINSYMIINWGNFNVIYGYYGIHFAFQYDTTFMPDALIYRNSGIFAEAPMFNLWLCIAVAIELFTTQKPRNWRLVLLAVTILTTMSVTGILFLCMCVALRSITNFRQLSRGKKCLLLIGAMVAVPVLVTVLVESMSLKAETQSFDMRLSDYIGGVELWMDYPFFGAGFGNLTAFVDYVYSPDGTMGFSNSIAAVLGTGGTWMAVLYYLSHIGMLFPKVTGSKKLACFGICMMFLFCTTIFFARYIGVLIVMLGLAIMFGPKNHDID